MSEQLPLGAIAETARIRELFDFADIVKNRPSEQEIKIDVLVMRCRQTAQSTKRKDVFEEPTSAGMMNGLGSRGYLVRRGKLLIFENSFEQRPDMRIP